MDKNLFKTTVSVLLLPFIGGCVGATMGYGPVDRYGGEDPLKCKAFFRAVQTDLNAIENDEAVGLAIADLPISTAVDLAMIPMGIYWRTAFPENFGPGCEPNYDTKQNQSNAGNSEHAP